VHVEIVTAGGKLAPMLGLLVEGLLCGRERAQQTELEALGVVERSAFGRNGVEQFGFVPTSVRTSRIPSVRLCACGLS
jgi:hypothetical protein